MQSTTASDPRGRRLDRVGTAGASLAVGCSKPAPPPLAQCVIILTNANSPYWNMAWRACRTPKGTWTWNRPA